MIEDTLFDNDCYAVFMEEEHEKEKRVRDNISRQAAIEWCLEGLNNMPSANVMTFEEIAKLLSDLCGECACDVNGNDEWLPQACKYADTECPQPKEKNGCWMQFLMQGGADMKGGNDAAD